MPSTSRLTGPSTNVRGNRREPFEFQAIRYAASYATLKTTQELVQNLYAPYIERHQTEFALSMLSATELAIRRLNEFLATNNATQDFNRRQRIVLIASSYDPQTLSACAWLAKNGIDIRCIEVRPLRHNQQLFFDIDHIIPPRAVDSFFVELATQQGPVSDGKRQAAVSAASRAYLPRMDKYGISGCRGHRTRGDSGIDVCYTRTSERDLKGGPMAERRAFNATSMLQQACVRQGIDLAALVAETAIWANPEVHRRLVAANPTGAWFPGFRRARTGSGEVRGGVVDGVTLDDNTRANQAIKRAIGVNPDDIKGFEACHLCMARNGL